MKLNGNQNIIFDNDIIMTGNSIGKSLSSVMNETTNDIAKLKAYLAWAYNHGGLGGTGSGSGTGARGSSNTFGANVWIDDVQVSSNGGSININKSVSTHTLKIKITKGGSDTYIIDGNYGSGTNKTIFSGNASLESNNLTQTFTLTKLVDNGSLYINITNASTEDTKEITYTYITNPYKFSFSFYNGDGTELKYEIPDKYLSTIFMENYTSGICLAFNYDIVATTLDYNRCYIEYNDLAGIPHTLYFKNDLNITSTGSGIIPLKLLDNDKIKSFFASTDSAGTYGINVATHIFNSGSNNDEGETQHYNITIIPNSLFLKVTSSSGQLINANKQNAIANAETLIENEQQFSSTQFSLSLTPYYGVPDSAKMYDYGYTIYNIYAFSEAGDADTDVSKLYEKVADISYSNNTITTYKLTTDTAKQADKTYYLASIPYKQINSPSKENIKLYYTKDDKTNQYIPADKFDEGVTYYVIKFDQPNITLGYVEVQNENTTGKLTDQNAKSISIIPGGNGIKFIILYLKFGNNVYYVGYYLKTKRASTKFTWYHTDPTTQDNSVTAYWRIGDSAKNIIINEALTLQEAASLNMAPTLPRKFVKTKFTSNDGNKILYHDVLLSLGIQYSKLNNINKPICSFNVDGSNSSFIKAGSIIVYQNKLSILNSDTSLDNNGFPVSVTSANSTDIFIPLIDTLNNSKYDNFHLLTIYFNNEFYDNATNSYSKSINCYIDGTLEGSLPTFINDVRLYSSVTFFPGLYYTNLLEITYLSHGTNNENNTVLLPTLQDSAFASRTYMTENDIKGYYYTYRALLANDSSNSFELWNLFNQLKYDDTNHVIYNDNEENLLVFINNLIKNGVDCPIMVLDCDNTNGMKATQGIGLQTPNIDNILEWIDGSYAESNVSTDNTGADPATGSVVVSLHYTSNTAKDKKISQVTGPDGEPIYFDVSLQGSSTKSYHGKNFEIKAQKSTSSKEGEVTLFTPNWKLASSGADAYDTFLPEKEFTLKGDIVDSSHSTNDVIGKFVNKTTTKFADAIKGNTNNAEASKYIKNCLLGFPILLFFVSKYTDANNKTVENIYFLGIYNFNLGRASYNNLGYNDLTAIENLIKNNKDEIDGTFRMFNVLDSDNAQLKGVEVAEVQENNRYFDFSQTQSSILFPKNDHDEGAMWGDFVTSYKNNDSIIQNHIQTMMRMVAKTGGDIFTILGKNMSEDGPHATADNVITQDAITSAYGYGEKYSAKPTQKIVNGNTLWNTSVPNYKHQVIRYNPGTSTEWYYSFEPVQENSNTLELDDFGKELKNVNNTLDAMEQTILDVAFPYNYMDGVVEKTNNPEIDIISLCEYYTICMAFGMVDSVQKNLNMKTWEATDNADSAKQTWYTAFYDMDTALGINNAGTKIDFFAFSDYWDCQIQPNETGLPTILSANIYRDYSPAMASTDEATYQYFDIPSNYLFAIAKYSHAILSQAKNKSDYYNKNNLQNIYIECNPATIWRKFRYKTTTKDDPKKGQLQNIDYFMDNYFLGYTENIPDEAWNFDYKYKYLVKTKIITNDEVSGYKYDNNNLGKFIGRKTYYTKYWLQNRIHLMDGYMNILGLDDVINTYKDTTGATLTVYADMPYSDNVPLDMSNSDNYMTRDIFSTNNQAPKYPQNNSTIEVTAESRAISIIKFSTTSIKHIIFPQNSEPLKIPLDIVGNNQAWFYGSQQWTKINNINNIIADGGNLSLTSDNLNEISANSGTLSTGITMHCPAITNIELTSPSFNSLNFNIDGTTDTYYRNLSTINLSNTKTTTVILQKINLAKLILNNMKGCNLTFTGLTNLSDCQLSGNFSTFNIECWNSYDSSSEKNINNLSGINMDFSQTMKVSNPTTADNKLLYNNAEINISNCEIYKTELTGFSYINISYCDKIYYIHINKPEKVERLSIVLNDTWDSKYKNSEGNEIINKFTLEVGDVNKKENGTTENNTNEDVTNEDIIDLHEFINLKYLCLTGCKEQTLILPDNKNTDNPIIIKLAPSCFEKNTNLNNIIFKDTEGNEVNNVTTQFVITGTNTFYNMQSGNAPLTTFFKTTNGETISLLHVSPECTSLKNTFNTLQRSNKALQYEHCKAFLDQIVLDDKNNGTKIAENITDISNMFATNDITYDFNTFQTDYNTNHTCSLNLWQFVNCKNWENCLYGNNVSYFNKYIYGGITKGENENEKHYGLGINYYSNLTSFEYKSLTNNTGGLYTTVDAFEYIMPYITKYNAFDLFYFMDNKLTKILGEDPSEPFKLNNVFCKNTSNGVTTHCKLKSINGFNVAANYSTASSDTTINTPLYYDLSGLFDCAINDSTNYVWENIHGKSLDDNTSDRNKTLSLINTLNTGFNVNSKNTDGKQSDSYNALNTLFANCKLSTIYNSIYINCDKNINLYSIFNWGVKTADTQTNVKKYEYIPSDSTFQYCTQLFMDYDETNNTSNYTLDKVTRSGFIINKQCTYEDFHKMIFGLLSSPIIYASGIFSDCNILINSDDYGKKYTDGTNNSLTNRDDKDAEKYFTFCDDKQFADYRNPNSSLKCINDMFINLKLILNDETQENLPIKINHNFMEFFTQITSLTSAFANWYVNNTIPFDIFRTRSTTTVTKTPVYLDENHTISGTLYQVSSTPTYNPTKFKGTFVKNCFDSWHMPVLTVPEMVDKDIQKYDTFGKDLNSKVDKLWKGRYAFKINRDYNNDYTYTDDAQNPIIINAVTGNYVIGQDGKVYDYYYKSDGSDRINLTNNDIFVQDAIDAEADNYSTYHYALHWLGQTPLYNNGCVDCSGCFISPDLLQGFTLKTVGWNSIISATNLGVSFTGTIPKHLFKNFSKSTDCLSFFNGYNITPIYMGDKYQYIKESHDDGNFEVKEGQIKMKYYKYIPDNLYNLQDIKPGTFGFNIILPHYDLDNEKDKYIEYFFVIDRNSIPESVTSIENPWPIYNTSTTYTGAVGDLTSSYSMLTTLWETTSDGITNLKDKRANPDNVNAKATDLLYTDSYIRYNICGNFVEENGKTTVTAGLDLSYFTMLKLDNLISSSDILPIMSGYLFADIPSASKTGFDADTAAIRFNKSGSNIISLQDTLIIPLIISYEMNLPLVTQNNHLIEINNQNVTVNKHSLSPGFVDAFNKITDWKVDTGVDKSLKTLQIVPKS